MQYQETLWLVTDGVIESLSGDPAEFHLDRLAEVFVRQRSPGDDLVEAVFGEVGQLKDSAPPAGGMTVLSLAWVGSRPPGLTP
jgi:hypothetical protein